MSKQKQEKLKILDGSRGMLHIYDDNIVFTPPLYRQRYQIVKDKIVSLSDGTFTKVRLLMKNYLFSLSFM